MLLTARSAASVAGRSGDGSNSCGDKVRHLTLSTDLTSALTNTAPDRIHVPPAQSTSLMCHTPDAPEVVTRLDLTA
jgi:hypothetical protein